MPRLQHHRHLSFCTQHQRHTIAVHFPVNVTFAPPITTHQCMHAGNILNSPLWDVTFWHAIKKIWAIAPPLIWECGGCILGGEGPAYPEASLFSQCMVSTHHSNHSLYESQLHSQEQISLCFRLCVLRFLESFETHSSDNNFCSVLNHNCFDDLNFLVSTQDYTCTEK